MQPRLGAWSDRVNRRLPFVVALSLMALIGLTSLLTAIPVANALSFEAADAGHRNESDNEAMSPVAVAMAYLGFAVADICFDCLLIPGRALLHDIAVPSSDAIFTGFQLGGRLLALLASSSSWTTSGLWGLYNEGVCILFSVAQRRSLFCPRLKVHAASPDAHFNACLTASATFLMCSMLAVLMCVDDQGSTYSIPCDLENNSARSLAGNVQIEKTIGVGVHSQIDTIPSSQNITTQHDSCKLADVPMIILCSVQALGWVGICAQSFFWTSWRGEKVGCTDLALQSVVGMATAGLIPLANNYFGATRVWFGSELFFHLLMISVGLISKSKYENISTLQLSLYGNVPRIIGALSGINYAVHATNGLVVATNIISDPNRRARTIAVVNNTLPLGQLITALSGGAIAQYFGSFGYAFVCYGVFGALLTSALWALSLRRGMLL